MTVSQAETHYLDYFVIILNIIVILFLVALNGFFVASEFSIVKVRPSRLDTLIKEGSKSAVYARQVTEHLDAYLSVTQLGITLASLGLGWIGEPAVAKMLAPVFALLKLPPQLEHTLAFVVGFSVITALHIVLGELVPKSLSIQKTETIVLFVARPLIMFDKLMYPAVWFLNHVANWTLRRMGISAASEAEEAHNEEEIRILMEESYKYGYIDKSELTYLDNVFDFSERSAGEIMVPRTDMICLYLEDSFDENIKTALTERMTRYPICNEDKDHIIGFLHIKDLLRALNDGQKPDLSTLARDVLEVPVSMPISNLLRLLQKERKQLAILIDEYGGTAGMVTIEDILEEIVGEIQDEFDEERPEVEEETDKSYSVDGKMLLEDVNDLFGLELDDGQKPDLSTLARDVLEVPVSMPISNLLRLLQKERKQLAILIDEYGGTAGMVTIEDILEEIVGEIQDEFDEERPEVEEETDKSYSVDGKMLLEDVNDLFGLELDDSQCDTIGGWVYTQLNTQPQIGQTVKLPKAEITVEEVEALRITRLKIKLLSALSSVNQGMLDEHLNKD